MSQPEHPQPWRKKPVVIDAIRYTGESCEAVHRFLGYEHDTTMCHTEQIDITTLEGVMTARVGDYIIRGVRGEYYPCAPEIFAATYEPAVPQQVATQPWRMSDEDALRVARSRYDHEPHEADLAYDGALAVEFVEAAVALGIVPRPAEPGERAARPSELADFLDGEARHLTACGSDERAAKMREAASALRGQRGSLTRTEGNGEGPGG